MPSTLASRMFASRLSIIPQVLRCSLRLGLSYQGGCCLNPRCEGYKGRCGPDNKCAHAGRKSKANYEEKMKNKRGSRGQKRKEWWLKRSQPVVHHEHKPLGPNSKDPPSGPTGGGSDEPIVVAGLAVEGTSTSNIRECKYLLTKVFTAVKLTEMDPLAEHCACTYWLGLSSVCGLRVQMLWCSLQQFFLQSHTLVKPQTPERKLLTFVYKIPKCATRQ